MNILYYTWQEIISDDIFSTLVSFGFNVTKLQYKLKNKYLGFRVYKVHREYAGQWIRWRKI